jgi:putative SOS response-associated peptidase YedK
MCGRFSLTTQEKLIEELFGVEVDRAMYVPRYNGAPTQDLAVISNASPGTLGYFRWGLIPFWAKDPRIGNSLINAKSETILEKPSFRQAFRQRRCLVPADGFYEWKKEPGKVPYRITLASGLPFAMAGIWDIWRNHDGREIRSFSILTTAANELMQTIHDRMPVILPRSVYRHYLESGDPAELLALLKPYPADEMKAYAVSTLVNSPRNDIPEVIQPVSS